MIKKNSADIILNRKNLSLISTSILLLRCTIGIILFVVGSGKILGWFGGIGFNTAKQFYEKIGFSGFLTYLSCYSEFIGGL